MNLQTPAHRPHLSRRAIFVCGGLLVIFAVVAWAAVCQKCSTYDEPVHAMGAWAAVWHGDFRIDPENPPLWEYWAALPQGRDALRIDRGHFERVLLDEKERIPLASEALYQTPGQDGEKFVRRSRAMMLIVSVMLGIVIAMWAGKMAGSVAAVVACGLYCLDPNFLGHAAIVKNDIAVTLALTWLAMAVWDAGRELTWWRGVMVALALSVCVTVKFSGLIAGPVLAVLLLVRVLMPEGWVVLGRELATRSRRLGAAVGLMVLSGLVSWGAIWACYQFRFDPTPMAGVTLDRGALWWRLGMEAPQAGLVPIDLKASEVQYGGWEFGPVRFVLRAHLLPEAYLHGLLYQMDTTRQRPGYLCGRYSETGWWWYFPVAMGVKTPVVTMGVVVGCAGWGMFWVGKRNRSRATGLKSFSGVWGGVCLGIPFLVYLGEALTSHLNIGVRHVFPLYPLMFVMAGVVAARVYREHSKRVRRAGIVLAVLLGAETLCAFPNYIAFFNFACGGPRGGLALLGDSNLDWGQDLPALARWQAEHLETVLRINYFGMVDPRFYGIEQVNAALGEHDVFAVSATNLQGIYQDEAYREKMKRLRAEEPMEVLGGTIYLYSGEAVERAGLVGP